MAGEGDAQVPAPVHSDWVDVTAVPGTSVPDPGAAPAGWSARPSGCPGCAATTRASLDTNLSRHQAGAQALYEPVYCARGGMEHRIKEAQLWLFADRISTATMRANQLRLTFATFAGVLITLLRRVGLQGTAPGPQREPSSRVGLRNNRTGP